MVENKINSQEKVFSDRARAPHPDTRGKKKRRGL